MNGFLYFVPNVPGVGDADFDALGIAGLNPRHREQGGIDRGPSGTMGVMLKGSGDDKVLAYKAECQTWIPGPGKKWWIGFETDRPPGPADLARKRMIAGQNVTLADGRKWHVPIARRHTEEAGRYVYSVAEGIPCVFGLDSEGNDSIAIARAFDPLWDAAGEFWLAFVGGASDEDAETMTYERQLDIVALSLSTNYRLGLFEMKALGLVGTDTAAEICNILIDADGFAAIIGSLNLTESGAEGNENDT